jgi:hypothetical protein
MRIRLAIPDRIMDADTLDALMEATTRAGVRQLKRGEAPDVRDAIRKGLRWRPERFVDGEHFDLPVEANQRGWGDCDDIAPWLAASLRASGEDPRARAVARRSGPTRWHIRVRRGNGQIVDPSRWAGMGQTVSGPEPGIHALAARPFAMPGDGAIALMPDRRRRLWWGRCDLPWMRSHLASVAPGNTPDAALYHAVAGAIDCSDGCSPEHAEYADALTSDLLANPRKQSVGFLGGLLKSAGGLMKSPLGQMASSLIPGGSMVANLAGGLLGGGKGGGGGLGSMLGGLMGGGGEEGGGAAPAAAAAAPGGMPMGGGGGGGGYQSSLPGGGHIAWQPQGPIIIRF